MRFQARVLRLLADQSLPAAANMAVASARYQSRVANVVQVGLDLDATRKPFRLRSIHRAM